MTLIPLPPQDLHRPRTPKKLYTQQRNNSQLQEEIRPKVTNAPGVTKVYTHRTIAQIARTANPDSCHADTNIS